MMDGLGPALFGLFLVSFTVSKPISLYHHMTLSSPESSESNESSSSEEVTELRPTIEPIELNTMIPDNLNETIEEPDPVEVMLPAAITEQTLVELNVNASLGPLQPVAPVTSSPDVQRVVFPDLSTPELRCYTMPVTSPQPQPARGDNV